MYNVNLKIRNRQMNKTYLRGEKNGVFVEKQSKMARQIKTPRQPFSGGYIQHRTAVRLKLTQMLNRLPKSVSIQRRSVADSAEIRQRSSVCSATYGRVLNGFPFVYFMTAVNVTGRCQNHHREEENSAKCLSEEINSVKMRKKNQKKMRNGGKRERIYRNVCESANWKLHCYVSCASRVCQAYIQINK